MNYIEAFAMPICVLLAIATCWLIRDFVPEMNERRYASLDGLRGFMAFLVFINHANVWYNYSHTGVWGFPAAYNHFNLSGVGVAVFFMITGFLFIDKLIEVRGTLKWDGFFVARIFRIYPLYVVVGLLTVLVTGFLSGFSNITEMPFSEHLKNVFEWLTFSYAYVHGDDWIVPGIDTTIMLALVTWSLPYEMFFYASLPVFALLFSGKPGWIWLVVGLIGCITLFKIDNSFGHQLYFVSGAIGAFLLRWPAFGNLARTPMAGILAITTFAGALIGFRATWGLTPTLLLLTIAFLIISNGGSLFGLLTARSARVLGEISYSLYLTHGFVLFCLFQFVLGLERAKMMSPGMHWTIIAATVPLVICFSLLTFRAIELPAMQFGKLLARALARRSKISPTNDAPLPAGPS